MRAKLAPWPHVKPARFSWASAAGTSRPGAAAFYPKGLTQARELHYASRELTSIEINSTFYGLQKPATFQKWHDETPDGFVFSVKAPRFVTHRKRLAEGASSVERFLESGVLRLGAKLGPINWQLAPTKHFDAEEIAEFLALLPRKVEGRALRHALEVRHASFDCEEFVAAGAQASGGRRRSRRFGLPATSRRAPRPSVTCA